MRKENDPEEKDNENDDLNEGKEPAPEIPPEGIPEDLEELAEDEGADGVDAGEAVAPAPDGFTPMKLAGDIYDWVEVFVATITVIFILFTFIARIAYVDGPSMNNTLHDKETLIVSNFFYTPKNNDIVVFQSPDSGIKGGIVKRVIATAGQTVDIDFDTWTVTVDGVALDESYVNYEDGTVMRSFDVTFPLTVPEGYVFVMGDNRNHSNDSRDSSLGTVDTRLLIGKAVFLVFPGRDYLTEQREFGRIGLLQ